MRPLTRIVLASLVALAVAGHVAAEDWLSLATVSMTDPNTKKMANRYVCYSDGKNIACSSPSLYLSTGGLVGINTTNPQTELEVNGTISATNFVGDGSGLTGVVASTGDRIVSGTNGATRMVAISSTGYISITQAGANSGWFDPTRGLVTLGVSSTGPISGTAGYFSGPVGIGTKTPSGQLQVMGNTFSYNFYNGTGSNAAGTWGADSGGSGAYIIMYGSAAANPDTMLFANSGGERMRIVAGGSVGIGSVAPKAKLDVNGTISATDAIQVGQSTLTCASGVSGSIRWNTTSGTIQVCNGTGWISLSSGTSAGVAALASLTDVNLTNIAGRDYLRYDAVAGKWVNISESTVMSTTTMVPGWPDAIRCNVTSPAIGYRVLYVQEAPYTDGKVTYRELSSQSSTNDRGVVFNSNGTFNSADFYTTHNCNTSISALYAAGQAFNFIGSANVTGTTAMGDRITSGTTTLTTISNTGYVSLTQGGANTAWFDPTRGLVTLGVSSTGPISGTSGYFSGNVGIGVTSPGAKLHTSVTGGNNTALIQTVTSGNAILQLNNSGGNDFQLYADRTLNQTVFRNMFGNDMVFKTGDVSRVTIASGGNVGISTSSPIAKLDVNGTISASDAIQVGQSALSCASGISGSIRWNTTSDTLQVCTGSGWKSLVSGTAGAGTLTGTGSATAVAFWNGASALTYDTDGFYWDATNNRLGVGTNAPNFAIEASQNVNGQSDIAMINTSTGAAAAADFYAYAGGNQALFGIRAPAHSLGQQAYLFVPQAIPMAFYTSGVERLSIAAGGNVGIGGMVTPTATLHVSGSLVVSTSAQNTSPSLYVGTDGTVGVGTSDASMGGALNARMTIVGAPYTTGLSVFGSAVSKSFAVNPVNDGGFRIYDGYGNTWNSGLVQKGGKVGVGLLDPVATLQVSGTFIVSTSDQSTSPSLYVAADGNVGIGTAPINSALHVVSGSAGQSTRFATFGHANDAWAATIGSYVSETLIELRNSGDWTARVRLRTGEASFLNGGNVGISTTTPNAKLDVFGLISATQIRAAGTISAGDVVQVSGSSLTCNGGLKGAIRYSNTSSTLEYCNSTAWTSLGPSDTSPVSFSVHKNGTNQTVTTNTPTKLTFSTEEFDTYNNFDTGTGRFTPTVPGTYMLQGTVYCPNATSYCTAEIRKNGTSVMSTAGGTTGNVSGQVNVLVSMNGTTDYVELWGINYGGTTFSGSADRTAFSGFLVPLYAMGGSGGGGTPAGSTGDIQFNNAGALAADTGQLFWDATNNRLGIGTGSPGARLDVVGSVSATGLVIKGVYAAKGLFTKEDPYSVAFTKTGNGTASVKAGTVVEVNNTLVNFSGVTAITMPALSAGTDYAIYACGDGTAKADSNLASTALCTGGFRKIGGFHYAPGGNAAAQAGGDTTAQINAYSMWDLKWRPACKNPAGMTLVADSFWVDIYLTNTDPDTNGTSKYNVTIADGSNPPKVPTAFGGNGSTAYGSFNWYEASEVMQSQGKDLLSQQEFMTAAYGTTEQSSGGTDPTSTVLRQAYTSKWGVMLATGNMWVWGRDSSYRYDNGTWAWTTTAGSRGQSYIQGGYGTVRALLGGDWSLGANSGSRASDWLIFPWGSYNSVGARGRCDHLRLE